MGLDTIIIDLQRKYAAARQSFEYCLNKYDYNPASIDWLYGDPAQKLHDEFKAEYQREIRTNKGSVSQLEEIVRVTLLGFLYHEYLLFFRLRNNWLENRKITDNGLAAAMENDDELSVLQNGYLESISGLINTFEDKLMLTTEIKINSGAKISLGDYLMTGEFTGDISKYIISKHTNDARAKLSLNEISLLYHYQDKPIQKKSDDPEQSSRAIAEKYGHTSGDALYNKYIRWRDRHYRKEVPLTEEQMKNKVALFNRVIDLLEHDPLSQGKANDDLRVFSNRFPR